MFILSLGYQINYSKYSAFIDTFFNLNQRRYDSNSPTIDLLFLGPEISLSYSEDYLCHFVFDHKLRLQVNLINGTNYRKSFITIIETLFTMVRRVNSLLYQHCVAACNIHPMCSHRFAQRFVRSKNLKNVS